MSVTGAFAVPHPPIILPGVGKGEEKKIQKTMDAYREIAAQIAALEPDTIVLTSPHSVMYSDYFHISPGLSAKGSLNRFGAPEVKVRVEYDADFVSDLTALAQNEGLSVGTMGERDAALDHATVIPLTFINEQYTRYKLVRIGLSGLSYAQHYKLGQCISKTAEQSGKNIVLVASGDLSHKVSETGPYGFAQEGVDFDRIMQDVFAGGDFLRLLTVSPPFAEKAAECGLRSFIIMAGALDRTDIQARLLSYEGTFGVGYGVASFLPRGINRDRNFLEQYMQLEKEKMTGIKENEDAYVRLARYSAEYFVQNGKRAKLPDGLLKELLVKKAGVFVSLKMHGELRGCIGTIEPVTSSIAQEIVQNAVSACADDPRFDPVQKEELPYLVYSVDVLSPAEPVQSENELDVKRYGVIVTAGNRRGLLLPQSGGRGYDQAAD